MTVKILLNAGECFVIPLRDGTFAFGQFVTVHPSWGALIRVFDYRSKSSAVAMETLAKCGFLIPGVFVDLNPPVRRGKWRKVGSLPVSGFRFPKFRRSLANKKGENTDWQIWDGGSWETIGRLTPEYRELEVTDVYSSGDIEDRILTGKNLLTDGIE